MTRQTRSHVLLALSIFAVAFVLVSAIGAIGGVS